MQAGLGRVGRHRSLENQTGLFFAVEYLEQSREFRGQLLMTGVGLPRGTELEFVIMVIAVSCVKLLSAHNSTQHTSRKHKV
jgi:hypothetical protein